VDPVLAVALVLEPAVEQALTAEPEPVAAAEPVAAPVSAGLAAWVAARAVERVLAAPEPAQAALEKHYHQENG
jgi:hypothetical protein